MTVEEKIIERVRKLLALSTSSNPNEAANAAAKAQELLQQYNLELSQVQANEQRGPEYIKSGAVLGGKQKWRHILLEVLCSHNFCKSFYYQGTPRAVIVGEKHNIEVVEYLYEHLLHELPLMASAAYKQSGSVAHPVTWKDAFYIGATRSISERMHEERARFEQESNNTRTLIVLKDKELQQAVQQFFPNTARARAKRVRSVEGYVEGVKAGQTVALRKAVE